MNELDDAAENLYETVEHALSDEQLAEMSKILFSIEASLQKKEKVLHALAHEGTEQACKILSAYKEYPDEELRFEAEMAYDECSFFLMQDMLADDVDDEDFDDKVFTGVGKKNNMMRIYYMVLPLEGMLFEASQHDIIRREMSAMAATLACEGIEWFDCQPHYVGFSLLQSLNVSMSQFIDTGIAVCNAFGDFVLPHYYAGTGVPTATEIEKIIDIVRYGEEEEDARPCEGEKPY